MRRTMMALALAASFGLAQTPGTGGLPARSMTGVLLDASCSTIAGRGGTAGSDATRSRTGGQSGDSGATSGAQSASAQGTTGTATAGSAPGASGDGGALTNPSPKTPAPSRDRGTGATSGANSASALGTTGAAPITVDASSGRGAAGANSSGVLSRGERTRLITTVREKYRDCMARATTTDFALHANGQLYTLDPASNDMVRQQMQNEAFRASMTDAAGEPQFITVMVKGSVTGQTLSITSVRR